MIRIKDKQKKEEGVANSKSRDPNKRPSIRDQLLVREVQEMEQMLPNTCQVSFDDPNRLHEFTLIIIPEEGYWVGGRFNFGIYVTEDYNMATPKLDGGVV